VAGATAANNIGALAIASNLSDVNNAGTSRTNLGLGTIATQNANAVAVTGGTVDGTVIGGSVTAAGSFTTLNASSTDTAAAFIPTGSTVPSNGVYLAAANSVTLATNSKLNCTWSQAANTFSALQMVPHGSGSLSLIQLINSSGADAGLIDFRISSTAGTVSTYVQGAGTIVPLDLQIAGVTKLRVQTSGDVTTLTGRQDQSYNYQTPATGFNITIGNNIYTQILDPAGALLTGTLTMPSSPGDGQVVRITSTQSISTLTVSPNAGQSIKNAPTSFTVSLTGDQGYEFIYRAANTTWYRLQ
jgi:hypothetical protein